MVLSIDRCLLLHSTHEPISLDEFPAWKMGFLLDFGCLLTFEWYLVIQV